jgi:hypothetical protein
MPKLDSVGASHASGAELERQARAFAEGGPGYVGV